MHRISFEPNEKVRVALASFRVRLILLAILAVLPALGLILYTAAEQRRQATVHLTESTQSLVRVAAADHGRLIEETEHVLRLLSRVAAVTGGDPEACRAFLGEAGELYAPRYTGFSVADASGEVVCISTPAPADLNVADRPYFQRAVATRRFALGGYLAGRVTGEAILPMAYPVLDEAGAVRQVMIATLSLRWLNDFAAQAALPAGGVLTLQDASGTILVRQPDPEDRVGQPLPDTPLLRIMREGPGEGTTSVIGIDGVERRYSYRRLHGSPVDGEVYLSIGIAKAAAFAEIDRSLTRNLVLLAAVAGFGLLAAVWGGDLFFLRRVRALIAATERLEAGDLTARTGLPPGRGELDRLAWAFDRTASALEQRTAALIRREREAQAHLTRIARLNRVHAVLSGVNSAVLRSQEAQELVEQICRVGVELGKFRLAVVWLLEAPGGAIRIAAHAVDRGREAEPFPPGEASPSARLPAMVLSEGRTIVLNDLSTLENAENGSAVGLPLRIEGEIVGALGLFAAERDFFDADEERLLWELAADTSYGLTYLERERKLQYFATHDPLTDLPNRVLFLDRLDQAITIARSEGNSVGLLSVGVPELEQINLLSGRAASDRIIQAMARHLETTVREEDSVARLGTTEFGVLLSGLEESVEIGTIAAKLAESAPRRVVVEGEEIFVSIRSGAAVFPQDGEEPEKLLASAALARQAATDQAVHFFSPELDAEAQQRRRIERELRYAIGRDELLLHYQPIVDLRDRRVFAVEALVRWRSHRLGELGPQAFIPIAEETELITPIGQWIVESACRQGRAWHQAGILRLRISVNVSAKQLQEKDFVARVAGVLKATALEPDCLSLAMEITESELMENVAEAASVVRKLRALGIKTYIDDFGTGYSSLSYLRELPIDTLKIDASFVRDLPSDEDAVAVIKGIVTMAHGLELRVIAEGVETEEQFALLRDLGCDAAQGYLFGRPVPPGELEQMLRQSEEQRTLG